MSNEYGLRCFKFANLLLIYEYVTYVYHFLRKDRYKRFCFFFKYLLLFALWLWIKFDHLWNNICTVQLLKQSICTNQNFISTGTYPGISSTLNGKCFIICSF